MNRLALLPIAFATSSALADTYYISPTGNDDANGSISAPWKSIQTGINKLKPGDTLYLRGGLYDVRTTLSFPTSGTGANWITVAGYPGEKPALDATNAPQGRDNGDSIVKIDRKNYIRVENLKLQSSNHAGLTVAAGQNIQIRDLDTYLTYDSGIGLWGDRTTNTPVKNVVVWGNRIVKPNHNDAPGPDWNDNIGPNGEIRNWAPQEAITIARTEDFEVAYNDVSLGQKEGIDAKGPDRRGVIHHNYVHHMDRVGFYVDAWTDTLWDVELHNNVSAHNGYGIQINSEDNRVVDRVTVRNNLVYGFDRIGIAVSGLKTGNVTVLNNTVIGGDHAYSADGTLNNVLFRNNIGLSIWQPFGSSSPTLPAGVTVDHHLLITQSASTSNSIVSPILKQSLVSAQAAHFIDPANGDFRLRSTSAAINAGHPSASYNDPDGTRNDLGALPLGVAGPVQPPAVTSGTASSTTVHVTQFGLTGTTGWTALNIGHGLIEKRLAADGTTSVVGMNGVQSTLSRAIDVRGYGDLKLRVTVSQTDVSYEGFGQAGDEDFFAIQYRTSPAFQYVDLLLDDSIWQAANDPTGNDFTLAPVNGAALRGTTAAQATAWLALPMDAWNSPNLQIRLVSGSSSEQEIYFVHSLEIAGAPIPEPAAALAIISALAPLISRRRVGRDVGTRWA
jgi:hypothetical protein